MAHGIADHKRTVRELLAEIAAHKTYLERTIGMTNPINDNAEISAAEVAQLLRDVIEGKHSIQLADDDLPWSTEGRNVPFSVDGWKVVFHNSLFVMNYVDSATASDGRYADFDDWQENPQSLLTGTEIALLEQIIEEQGRAYGL